MATPYKTLIAMSESHTRNLSAIAQQILVEKKARLRRQAEQDRLQKVAESKLRLWYLDEQKRTDEAERKKTETRRAAEVELVRRQTARRKALLYGPKSKRPTSISGALTCQVTDREDEEEGPKNALTREEKREKRRQEELNKAFRTTKPRSSSVIGRHKRERCLAYDANVSNETVSVVDNPSDLLKVKERLAAKANALIRLNVVKRDTRSIDEIVRDRRRDKGVLDGERARSFADWFSPSMRTDPPEAVLPVVTIPPVSSVPSLHFCPPRQDDGTLGSAPRRNPLCPPENAKKRARPVTTATTAPPSKRFRGTTGPSVSPSAAAYAPPSLGQEIWSIFGKDKAAYVAVDVLSDSEASEEPMETGADAVELEEKISDHIARKEDQEAEMLERSRQKEKRR
ncbi:hypothetical protein C8R46DRAFT_900884 [Mycena filopes]|nr:hypothetical protein C8R46DRAFT_900884 [Mycena filopes]